MGAAAIKIPSEFTAVDKFTSVVKKMTAGVSKFAKSGVSAVRRFDTKINQTYKGLGKIQKLALGLGVGALFSMAIQNNIAYNDSLASLSAITGATGNELVVLEDKVLGLAKKTSTSGSDIAKAFEVVGSAKPELLESADALAAVTDSVITLSKASRLDLETSALALTDVMNQFNLAADQSNRTINVLAAGAKFGAAAIPLVKDSIVQFGTAAKAANVSVEQSVALVETLADKGIKGAEAGTKLRNVLSNMNAVQALPKKALDQLKKFGVDTDLVADKNVDFGLRLKELAKIAKDPVAMVKVFGKENNIAAGIVLNNIERYEELNKKLTGTTAASQQAAIQTNTLQFALGAIKTAFLNTTTATNSNNTALDLVKDTLKFVAKHMDLVVGAGVILMGVYGALKTITIGTRVAMVAYNIVLGVQAALNGTLTKKIVTNTVALQGYKVAAFLSATAAKAMTAAQWLLNIAMDANPIGLIIIAIAALIGLVVWAIAKYDEWGAALLQFMGPIGWIINLFKSFQAHWDSIVQAFKTDGILAGLKRIGAVILDAVLMPMQQFLGLLSKIPGVGKLVAPAIGMIDKLRTTLDLNTDGQDVTQNEQAQVLPSTAQTTNQQLITKNNNTALDINLKDPGGSVQTVQQSGDNTIPINISQTQGAY